MADYTVVLKVCEKDDGRYVGRGGFEYPYNHIVEAPDWRADESCGGGLHGWECGRGTYTHAGDINGWVVLLVDKDQGFVDLGDKCKFRRGLVYSISSHDRAVWNLRTCMSYLDKQFVVDINTVLRHDIGRVAMQTTNPVLRNRLIQALEYQAQYDSASVLCSYDLQAVGSRPHPPANQYETAHIKTGLARLAL